MLPLPDTHAYLVTAASSYSKLFQYIQYIRVYIYIYSKCENMSFASFGFESKFVVGPVTVCQ